MDRKLLKWTVCLMCLTTIGICLQTHGAVFMMFQCPGARPCWACRVRHIAPNRDPCLGGCYCPSPGEQPTKELPVDGYCPDELPIVWSRGYVICYRRTNYRPFICCRDDLGCKLNPFEPNGQWCECLCMGYECEDLNGNLCPFMAWTYGQFCVEQNGRPCCDPAQPCRP